MLWSSDLLYTCMSKGTYLFGALDGHFAEFGEDEVLGVLEAGILFYLFFRAESFLHFGSDLLFGILHKDRRLGVRLTHFLLALLESRHHVVGQDDRLVLNLRLDQVAILPCEHIHLWCVEVFFWGGFFFVCVCVRESENSAPRNCITTDAEQIQARRERDRAKSRSCIVSFSHAGVWSGTHARTLRWSFPS